MSKFSYTVDTGVFRDEQTGIVCVLVLKQESRAAARKPRVAASVLFRWSSPTTFTTSI